MAERRSLIEGLKNEDDSERDREEQFVYNTEPRHPRKAAAPTKIAQVAAEEPKAAPPVQRLPATIAPAASSPLTGVGRVPVGARIRTELATNLKRASLERQLQGIQPNSVQDILEEAMELWLHKHGHWK